MKTHHPPNSTQAQFKFHILGELALTSAELLSWVTVKIAVGSLALSSLKLMGTRFEFWACHLCALEQIYSHLQL